MPTNYPSSQTHSKSQGEPGYKKHQIQISASNNDETIASKDALLLEVEDFKNESTGVVQNEIVHVANSLSQYGMNVTTVNEGSVTLDHFKNLSGYGVIGVVSHGNSYLLEPQSLFDLFGWWDDDSLGEVGDDGPVGIPVIWTPFQGDDSKKADIAAGRLAVDSGNNVHILPAFIAHYNKEIRNTIVWMGICRGAFNDELANSFMNAGASVYLGFSEIVGIVFAKQHGENFFDHLVLDKIVSVYDDIGDIE